jgi:hypothetical protein
VNGYPLVTIVVPCHSERSKTERQRSFAKSKNLMRFASKRNYMRSFDSVFLSFVEKNSAQDDSFYE